MGLGGQLVAPRLHRITRGYIGLEQVAGSPVIILFGTLAVGIGETGSGRNALSLRIRPSESCRVASTTASISAAARSGRPMITKSRRYRASSPGGSLRLSLADSVMGEGW